MKRLILVSALATALISGCGGGDDDSDTGTQGTSTSAEIPGVGDSRTVDLSSTDEGKLTVTLVAADFNPTPPEFSEVYPLRKGHRWANVKLRVVNAGDAPSRQSAINYALLADDGRRVDAYDANAFQPVISCCGTGYQGDAMQPGDKAIGFVAFQIPIGFQAAKLRAAGIFDDPAVEWSLR